MKLIIAGSRGFGVFPISTDREKYLVERAYYMADCKFMNDSMRQLIQEGLNVTEVVSGRARGADKLGEWWAVSNSVPVRKFSADWKGNGKVAGFRRNEEMGAYAGGLAAFWDGQSRGTKHMMEVMRGLHKPVWEFRVLSR